MELIGANCRWDHDGQPYWEGEVEPCINGRTVANGTYFGLEMGPLVEINVLEGLLEYERATGGTADSRAARRSGEEYLLKRHLFRRLSTGEPIEKYLRPRPPAGRGEARRGGSGSTSTRAPATPRAG